MSAAITPPPWTDQALCAQTDPEAFFPELGATTLAAKRICATCPVRAECLDYALATETPKFRHGVWGGLSPRQRDRLPAATHGRRPRSAA